MRPRHAVSQLERHYRLIQGELTEIERKIIAAGVVGPDLRAYRAEDIHQRRDALVHITFCMRLFEPDWTPDHLRPIRPRKPTDPYKWGKLLNMAYDVLRSAPGPLSSTEILDTLWREGRVSRNERTDFRSRLTTLMRGQEKAGAVRSTGVKPLHWSIIRGPTTASGSASAEASLRPATAASSPPTASTPAPL